VLWIVRCSYQRPAASSRVIRLQCSYHSILFGYPVGSPDGWFNSRISPRRRGEIATWRRSPLLQGQREIQFRAKLDGFLVFESVMFQWCDAFQPAWQIQCPLLPQEGPFRSSLYHEDQQSGEKNTGDPRSLGLDVRSYGFSFG